MFERSPALWAELRAGPGIVLRGSRPGGCRHRIGMPRLVRVSKQAAIVSLDFLCHPGPYRAVGPSPHTNATRACPLASTASDRHAGAEPASSYPAMPHELLLFAQLPNSRLEQLLNIVAGIAGAQPQRVIERHVVYRPQRDPLQRQYAVGASQNVQTTQRATSREQLSKDMFYWQTVKELDDADFGPAASTEHAPKEKANPDAERKGWAIQFQDIPEAGQRPVTTRWVQTTDVVAGNPHAHMKATMYKYGNTPPHSCPGPG